MINLDYLDPQRSPKSCPQQEVAQNYPLGSGTRDRPGDQLPPNQAGRRAFSFDLSHY